jgi:hypothetical protein
LTLKIKNKKGEENEVQTDGRVMEGRKYVCILLSGA